MSVLIFVAFLCTLMSFILWFKFRGLEYILIRYRWIFVIFFLMPASLLYNIVYYIRNWLIFKLNSAPSKHDAKVRGVQRQIFEWNKTGCKTLMCTARPGWMAMSLRNARYKDYLTNVMVNMMDILEVSIDKETIRVEPLVTMGQITATLLPLGWTLPVVPELDDLTIGGLIMGTGIETSSHKYGLMQHILVSAEVVVSDGSVIKCSKKSTSDLFYALPWSHGTLGFLVAAELRIIQVKKYVRLAYYPVHSLGEIVRTFSREIKRPSNDFVEGLMYSENEAVIMTGIMIDEAETVKINAIGSYCKPWFFKHVEDILHSGVKVEYIPIRHYYHRHTKGLFWQMQVLILQISDFIFDLRSIVNSILNQDIVPFGNNIFFRYLFGWLMPPKVSLLKLTHNQTIKNMYEKYQIIQDILLPLDDLSEGLQFFHHKFQIYPLWLCPFWLPANPGFVQPNAECGNYFVDIGAYGSPKKPNYKSIEATRDLEKFTLEHKGFQMLYADSYLTREEFHTMFDHTLYQRIRSKYNCDKAFPEVYDKVNRKARV